MEFVCDDGGRAAAGYRGKTGDCVARAVAIASGRPYADVYAALAQMEGERRQTKRMRSKPRSSARSGIHTTRLAFKDYMRSLGFAWTPTMGIGTGCRVHLASGELPMGRLVVAVSKHYTAVIDGVIHDTYDPQRTTLWADGTNPDGSVRWGRRSERCVYGYWRLEAAV